MKLFEFKPVHKSRFQHHSSQPVNTLNDVFVVPTNIGKGQFRWHTVHVGAPVFQR